MRSIKINNDEDTETKIKQAAEWIKDATHILVGAGAGMSTEAGNDYTDPVSFAKRFPAMVKRGYRIPYEFVGKSDWESPELLWGYLSTFVNLTRFNLPKAKVYSDLYDIIKSKDYFIITSNADGMFEVNGYDLDRVYTPQGDFKYIQCKKPCSKTAYWPSKSIIENLANHVDRETQLLTDSSLLPKCPHCGGPATMNVRGGNYFLETPHEAQLQNFNNWVKSAITQKVKLVIIEIGAGFNTPTVIRHRMEWITYQTINHKTTKMIRINMQYPELSEEIADVSVGIPCKTTDFFQSIKILNSIP